MDVVERAAGRRPRVDAVEPDQPTRPSDPEQAEASESSAGASDASTASEQRMRPSTMTDTFWGPDFGALEARTRRSPGSSSASSTACAAGCS